MSNTVTGTTTAVIFQSIIIESERNDTVIDIARVTSDIDIYEHIDKPYLTGVLGFSDTSDVVGSMDIIGGERVTITLKSSRQQSQEVVKTFYIDRILTSQKGNTNSEYTVLHLIEDIGYKSALFNVNRSYNGKCSEIITKVCKEFLGKDVATSDKDYQQIKAIIPNLNPIQTISWIKNRSTTNNGYPFYLFSTLVKDELFYMDLETMLSAPAINTNIPFTYNPANVIGDDLQAGTEVKKNRVILSYNYSNVENLLALILKGVVGSKYDYYDVTNKVKHEVEFDVIKHALEPFYNSNSMKGLPNVSDLFEVNGKSFNTIQSRHVSQIGTTVPYDGFKSLHQSDTAGQYRFNVISRAMDSLIKKNPLSITVNGIDFMDGDKHNTIGNTINVKFLRNVTDNNTSDRKFDSKKSGKYLVFATKHSFKLDSYHTTLSCMKLTSGEVQ